MKNILTTYGPIGAIVIGAIILGTMDTAPKGYTNFYDKNLSTHPPTCLALPPIPGDNNPEIILKDMYSFRPNCPYRLSIATKENIHCNSNQNSERKALSAFPTSFIRMEIHRGMRLVYSYYVDLPKSAEKSDIRRAFEKVLYDLELR